MMLGAGEPDAAAATPEAAVPLAPAPLTPTVPKVRLTDLEADVGARPLSAVERHRGRLGLRFAGLIFAMFVISLIFVVIVAVTSYPDIADYPPGSASGPGADRTYLEARQSWLSGVKDLLQILVVSLLVPMLSSLIGYLFGRRDGAE